MSIYIVGVCVGFARLWIGIRSLFAARKIEAVKSLYIQAEKTCITQHPGFSPVCLNIHVLRTAWFQYRQGTKYQSNAWH